MTKSFYLLLAVIAGGIALVLGLKEYSKKGPSEVISVSNTPVSQGSTAVAPSPNPAPATQNTGYTVTLGSTGIPTPQQVGGILLGSGLV